MMSSRAKPTSEFADPELSTSKHDEIMLWLDENIVQACGTVLNLDWQKKIAVDPDKVHQFAQRVYADVVNYKMKHHRTDIPETWQIEESIEPVGLFTVYNKCWEFPIVEKRFYRDSIKGFIDLHVTCGMGDPALTVNLDREQLRNSQGEPCWAWKPDDPFRIPQLYMSWPYSRDICFEVKPTIRSLGEVIRQIRWYQQFLPIEVFVVVSPDDRGQPKLAEQGIQFVKVP